MNQKQMVQLGHMGQLKDGSSIGLNELIPFLSGMLLVGGIWLIRKMK